MLDSILIIFFCPIFSFSLAGRSEYSLSRKYDPRTDDSRNRRTGHEENWSG